MKQRNLIDSAARPALRAVYLPVTIERMTDDEAQRRLAEVRVALASTEHYQATSSRNYGNLDPLDNMAVWLQPCRACGARPGLFFDVPQAAHMRGKGRSKRWFARCGCGALGLAVRLKHEAVGIWNRSGLAKPMPWDEFPFFNIAHLSPREARRKLASIEADLNLRLREAYLRLKLHDPVPPGSRYVNSLGAYRDWALYGQWLLKTLPTSDNCAKSVMTIENIKATYLPMELNHGI